MRTDGRFGAFIVRLDGGGWDAPSSGDYSTLWPIHEAQLEE